MANNIRKYRKEAKMTQSELAARVGCRRETIANLESGKYSPSLELADGISVILSLQLTKLGCDRCNVTVYDLFDLHGSCVQRARLDEERRKANELAIDNMCKVANSLRSYDGM